MDPWVGNGSKGSRGDGEKLTDLSSGSALDAIPIRVMSKGTKNLFYHPYPLISLGSPKAGGSDIYNNHFSAQNGNTRVDVFKKPFLYHLSYYPGDLKFCNK
jgi:hypothetical protein